MGQSRSTSEITIDYAVDVALHAANHFPTFLERAPLLAPALAFALGIAISEARVSGMTVAQPIVAALLLMALIFRARPHTRDARHAIAQDLNRSRSAVLHSAILVISALAGCVAHQRATRLPTEHVANLVSDTPRLTRIAGVVVSQPLVRPPEKRNPFTFEALSPRTSFVLAARELRVEAAPASVSGLLRVHIDGLPPRLSLGDEIELTGWLYSIRGPRNPGEPDWRQISRLEGIYAGLTTDSANVQVTPRYLSWQTLLGRFRAVASGLLLEPYGGAEAPGADLLEAMVLGQRSAVSRDINEAFFRVGAIHVLSVGGFHVALLSYVIWRLGRLIPRVSPRFAALLSMAGTIAYAALAEPNAPVLRAALMGVLLCFAQFLNRPINAWNWLAFAAIIILASAPLELFRPGFQLSFIQVAALIGLASPLYRRLISPRESDAQSRDAESWRALGMRYAYRALLGLLIINLVAWVISLPLVIYHFGRVSLWAPLLTLIVTPGLVVVTLLSFVVLLVSAVSGVLAAPLGYMLSHLTYALLAMVGALADFAGPPLECRVIWSWPLLIAYVIVFIWGFMRGHRAIGELWRADLTGASLVAALAVVSIVVCLREPPIAGLRANILDVGAGSAALLQFPGNHALIVDLGTTANYDVGEMARRACTELYVRHVDALAVSHNDFDHFSGMPTLLQSISPREVWLAKPRANEELPSKLQFALQHTRAAQTKLCVGDSRRVADARIDVLWPPASLSASWSDNDSSLVLRITVEGRSLLLPGDVEGPAMAGMLERFDRGEIELRSDVLIAPHHGSVRPLETAAFLRAVEPSVVIASSGEERPKLDKLIRDCLGDRALVYNTHDSGAIEVELTTEAVRVHTPFARKTAMR